MEGGDVKSPRGMFGIKTIDQCACALTCASSTTATYIVKMI